MHYEKKWRTTSNCGRQLVGPAREGPRRGEGPGGISHWLVGDGSVPGGLVGCRGITCRGIACRDITSRGIACRSVGCGRASGKSAEPKASEEWAVLAVCAKTVPVEKTVVQEASRCGEAQEVVHVLLVVRGRLAGGSGRLLPSGRHGSALRATRGGVGVSVAIIVRRSVIHVVPGIVVAVGVSGCELLRAVVQGPLYK